MILGGLIVLVGLAVVWWLMRKDEPPHTLPPGAEIGNYGRDRWERERRMWAATLERLHRQAATFATPPPHLARDIERARERLQRAEAMLNKEVDEEL
nr:hypothetical protein [Ardenticatena sp.]